MPFLKKNVSQIIKEVQIQNDTQIEIYISDNFSNDGTQTYLKELVAQHDYINVHLHGKNMGANHNFYTVLKGASGDYIWLLGDDDMIVEGAIINIIQDINRYQPGVLLGGTVDDKQLQRVYLKNIVKHKFVGEEILQKFNAIELAGKMSVLIFSRAALMKVLNEGLLQINKLRSPWPHLIWFLQVIAQGHKILILPYPTNYIIRKNRYNNLQDGKERLSLLFVDYYHLSKAVLPHFSKNTQKNLIRNLTKGRVAELVKNVAYSTFMNAYKETLIDALYNIKYFPTFKNKMRYVGFYFLPILLPLRFRIWCFKLPIYLKLNLGNYIDFINYLEKAK
ncbi:MAG: glycosyltransferase, partial [Gammaproteobacteria bacterium]|nr:glycosyltransferase [Gammaproteobacteria bacterium]